MFGLSFDKLLVLGLIAVLLLGPSKLPQYAAQLARWAKKLRSFADDAKDRMREEMGPEFDDVDWKKLDPRQYDPRRIIREALLEDDDTGRPESAGPAAETAGATAAAMTATRAAADRTPLAGATPPYDVEAT